jgi:hypothetical protein
LEYRLPARNCGRALSKPYPTARNTTGSISTAAPERKQNLPRPLKTPNPCLSIWRIPAWLRVTAKQGEIECSAEALVTVTETLIPESQAGETKQGIPSYTFQKAPGELWRSRYDADKNLVIINNGHRDFVFASRQKALKLRYICRLFTKELVVKNFAGAPATELLERLIELSLYTEENLR